MNYIKEINAFYNHLEFNPLSNAAVLLWHALMQINNKAGWRKEFTVAANVLAVKAQLKDSTFKRAREELREKGYIHFQSRGGNQSAIYQMISLTFTTEPNSHYISNEIQENNISKHKANDKVNSNMDDRMNHKPAPLTKQENVETKKDDIIKTTNNVVASFYEENFGKITPYVKKEITSWVENLNEALILEAMKQALERNHIKWNYVKAILQTWKDKGLTSLADVEADMKAFKQKQRTLHQKPMHVKQEVIPDWHKSPNQQPSRKLPGATDDQSSTVDLLTDYLDRKRAL
ncbi:DnaD domain-containing protein [Aquibacillus albus]|uniref:DnaD/phage-associated family protein n=1 Tax=Aquibacillus albus TaxID=1168171 RepID=A0ABS2MZR4_9BACI|nr:DnaD domain protein [Aquibacillus albus]MBM7571400.1 DnaD/phage-associated family protein [Aquibacillus albus]